jgi:5-formyltetrahydrofolate cyclo-ligase
VERPAGTATKSEWRTWARGVRAGVDFDFVSDGVVGHLADWEALHEGATVLLFLPLPDEVNLLRLIEDKPECRFVTTRTPDRGGVLTVHELGGPLEVHRIGFLQPHPTARRVDPGDVDMMLLPGLAFSVSGTRLGRGGGYFDELLSRTPASATLVGVAPEAVIVEQLPAEAHDVGVGHLATEVGVRAIDPAGPWEGRD